MLGNVMPHRGTFFNLLAAHADRLVAGANANAAGACSAGWATRPDKAPTGDRPGDQRNRGQCRRRSRPISSSYYEFFTTPINTNVYTP